MATINLTTASAATAVGTWNTVFTMPGQYSTELYNSSTSASLTFTATGRALYLIASQGQLHGSATVTVDGVPYQITGYGNVATNAAYPNASGVRARVLIPIARYLSDTTHTVVITPNGDNPFYAQGLLAVTGAALQNYNVNQLLGFGEDDTSGHVIQSTLAGSYLSHAARLLRGQTGQPWTAQSQGVTGDRWYATGSTQLGGHWQIVSYAQTAIYAPKVIALLFGTNDLLLDNTPAGDYAGHLNTALALLEDLFDVQHTAVVACTPVQVVDDAILVPAYNIILDSASRKYSNGDPDENMKTATSTLQAVLAAWGWASVGYTRESLLEHQSYQTLNNTNGADRLWLNEGGHSVVGTELARVAAARLQTISIPTFAANPLLANAAAYYAFEDGSGSSLVDRSGNANTGTWHGTLGSQWSTGKIGGGGVFNGTDNAITIPDSSSLRPASFTLAAWVKPAAFTNQMAIMSKNANASWSYPYASFLLRIDSASVIDFGLAIGGTYTFMTASVSLTAGQWVRIAATYDTSTGIQNVYLNGTLVGTHTTTGGGAPAYYAQPLTIGADAGASPYNDYFNGTLDEVMLLNRALSATEMNTDYNNGQGYRPF